MKIIKKILLLVMTLVTLAACSQNKVPFVALEPQSMPRENKEINEKHEDAIKVAIASVMSPKESKIIYEPLLLYLEKELGKPIELVQRQTYQEIYQLLKDGSVDVGFICSLVYTIGQIDGNVIGIAAPEVQGKPLYRSYVIAKKGGAIQSFDDLRGRTFAFTDPLSFSGRLAVLGELKARNLTLDTFFSRTYFTYSHDYSIKAVSKGTVDAAAVDSLIFDQMKHEDRSEVKNLEVVYQSDWVGAPPIVVPAKSSPVFRDNLTNILLRMDQTREGKEVLKALQIDRYSSIDRSQYRSILDMASKVGIYP